MTRVEVTPCNHPGRGAGRANTGGRKVKRFAPLVFIPRFNSVLCGHQTVRRLPFSFPWVKVAMAASLRQDQQTTQRK